MKLIGLDVCLGDCRSESSPILVNFQELVPVVIIVDRRAKKSGDGYFQFEFKVSFVPFKRVRYIAA